ncbi:hypothetical protein LEP1GSC148_1786 [Leptospira interrogans serovar Canicola str. LT1962]|nr:hypothetical protein LEP1GSC148_1786 [Leptospira interrogans serovar Canicola str. LT1962]
MKDYIIRGGEQELPPPYQMKQVEFYFFVYKEIGMQFSRLWIGS